MDEKKTIDLTIEELEERIAPGIMANFHALPPNNDGTANAAGGGGQGMSQGQANGGFLDRWFGKAAGC